MGREQLSALPASPVLACVLLALLALAVGFLLRSRSKRQKLECALAERLAATQSVESEELMRSEAKYRALAVNAPVGIFEANIDGDCTFVNQKWEQLTGLTFEEAMGKGWMRAMHPDDAERVGKAWYEAAVAGVLFSIDFRYLSTRREVVWVQASSMPLRAASGALTGCIGTIVDVTERRRVLQALAASESNFRLLVENAPFGVMVFRRGEILFANRSCLEMLGYGELAELKGRQLIETVVHPEERELAALRMASVDGRAPLPASRMRCIRKDGSELVVEGVATMLLFDGEPALAGVARDVTEEQRREQVRLEAEQALRESLREKEMLLKEVHHRVKNNLQVIVSLINLQASKLDAAETRAIFEETRGRVHAIALLHERLYRAKNLGRIDMRDYLDGLVGDLSSTNIDMRPIELRVHAQNLYFEMDTAVPVGLIVNELVTNAFKHAFPCGYPRRGTIDVELSRAHDQIVVAVADDGVGLPVGFHADELETLGLLLISSLSEQLDGELSFEPQARGMRATVRFPAPEREDEKRPPVAP